MAIAQYATVVGLTPEKFLNGVPGTVFLSVPANDDNDNGNAEEYLDRFTFKNRATAERLAAWMLDRFNRDPVRAREQSLKLK